MPKLYAYTDGACSGNPGPGGWGVLLLAKQDDNIIKTRSLSGGAAETTNTVSYTHLTLPTNREV